MSYMHTGSSMSVGEEGLCLQELQDLQVEVQQKIACI